jgi:hypothetical protein
MIINIYFVFRKILSCSIFVTDKKSMDIVCLFVQNELSDATIEKHIVYLLVRVGIENNEYTALSTNFYT